MALKDQIDQDALAAEWGVALDAEQQAPQGEAGAQPSDSGSEPMAAAMGEHGR